MTMSKKIKAETLISVFSYFYNFVLPIFIDYLPDSVFSKTNTAIRTTNFSICWFSTLVIHYTGGQDFSSALPF